MDGTNSVGRKVSLLNDHEPPHLVRFNSFAPSLRSRTSSYDSSSVGSPPTPQLVRSNSSDSASMQTPSPITPDFGFPAGGDAPDFSQASFFPQQKEIFPHMYDIPGAIPYHSAHSNMHYQHQQQQPIDGAAPPNAVPANGRPKKNQYPCPMAKAIGCKDHFTTSGHAARHAKKHTGKKDAVCPECNKAFTRKDNMEQHRRTHQSGRGASKASERDVKKAKLRTQAPRPKASPILSESTTPNMASMNFDPALPHSPTGSFSAVMQSADSFVDYNQRTAYPDPSAFAMNNHYMNGYASGLDTLASAASREQQNLEEEESVSEDEQRHKRPRHQ